MKKRKIGRPRTMSKFLSSSSSHSSSGSISSSQQPPPPSSPPPPPPPPPPSPPPPTPPLSSPPAEVQVAAPNGRGQSKGITEWNTGVKVEVMFDSTFQPVGPRVAQLKSQLGQIVRDGHRIPLTIIDWKAVGDDVKEGIWTEVKKNLLNVPEGYKAVCLRCCNTLWKDHKSKTKCNFFEKNNEDPDLSLKVPAHIMTEQWSELVAYWSSEDAKMIARRNSNNRELRGPVHTTGRKHFAQLRHEMEQNGEETDKMNVWKKARDQSNRDVAEAIEEYEKLLLLEPEDQRNLKVVKDRIFHEVIGKDGHGYCRTYGSGVSRRSVYPNEPICSQTTHDIMQKMTESLSKIQNQLNTLQARIDLLENKGIRDTNLSGQVPDATSGHEMRREFIGDEANPPEPTRDKAMD